MASSNRDKIIEAFLALLAEKPFERIGLAEVAEKAGVSLADMRGDFGSTFDMIAAFMRETDRKVLAGGEGEDVEATARDRLFDVLMRRFEALLPHREAVRSLARSAERHPRFALALNKLAVRSQQWMLSGAGIGSAGLIGGLRAQAVAVLFARVMRVWLNDDDPGLARTMAELDRDLATGARLAMLLDDLCRLAPRCPPRRRRARDTGPRRTSDPSEPEIMRA
ncbi:MAG TPA: TetR/AcrR family transcriptional regulator [Xanthobacteraceae bacterium]|nr:TetR/AcrR family transcriptional regulator [Xanthobacteraceae bacterium]